MKISKSKQELARIISENGGWRDGAQFSAQDKDGEVFHYAAKPTIGAGRELWGHEGCIGEGEFTAEKLPNWHQTTLSRDEYFHLYPEPDNIKRWEHALATPHPGYKTSDNGAVEDADGWVEWKSPFYGSMPCDEDAEVDIKVGDEIYYRYVAKCWKHWGSVTAYRLHKPEQAKTVGADAIGVAESTPEAKPTIEQLAADYRNAKDYAERLQQKADAARADTEAKLKALTAAARAIDLYLYVSSKSLSW